MTNKIETDLIIFDLDGTLAETRQDIADAANYMLQKLNRPPLPEEIITGYVGNGIKKLIERCLPGQADDLLNKAYDFFVAYYADHLVDDTHLYPGVLHILNKFKNKKMAVLSNKAEKFTIEIMRQLKIEKYFQIVMGSNPPRPKKPTPDAINQIIQSLDCSAKKTIIIGDTKNDILAGQAANIYTCAVSYGFRDKAVLQKYNPDFMIDSLEELDEIIS